MFTIKHIDAKGAEFVMECTSYHVSKDEQGLTRLIAYETPFATGDYIGLWAGEAVSNSPNASWRIFVMNRFGSTVGAYGFNDFNFDAHPLPAAA